MMTSLRENWPHVLAVVSYFLLTLAGSLHVVLYKGDTRSAVGWIGMILVRAADRSHAQLRCWASIACSGGRLGMAPGSTGDVCVGHRKSHQSAADHQP